MRRKTICHLIAVTLLLAAGLAFAQKADMPKYDRTKEVTFKGTVEEVKEIPAANNEVRIHLMVKSGSDVQEVSLCPHTFLKATEVDFAKGDQLEVTGSKVKMEDKTIVLAREIVKGNNTLVLRDKDGTPVWTWLKKG